MDQITRQHSPYDLQTRAAVCQIYFSEGVSMADIANRYGNHPNRDTVSRIVQDYVDKDCTVVALQGRLGSLHLDRRFNDTVLDALMIIIQDEEQFLLRGKWIRI